MSKRELVMTNVQQGDLARVVGVPGNVFSVVSVIEPMGVDLRSEIELPAWVCECFSTVTTDTGIRAPRGWLINISDSVLRRLGDGQEFGEIVIDARIPESEPA